MSVALRVMGMKHSYEAPKVVTVTKMDGLLGSGKSGFVCKPGGEQCKPA